MARIDERNEELPSTPTVTPEPKRREDWKQKLLIPFASLQNRNFRLLWLGMLGQSSAMWADQVARS